MAGGFLAGILYEYIFDPYRRSKTLKAVVEEEDSGRGMASLILGVLYRLLGHARPEPDVNPTEPDVNPTEPDVNPTSGEKSLHKMRALFPRASHGLTTPCISLPSLSISISLYLSLSFSLYLSPSLSIYISLYPSPSICLPLSLSISLYTSLYIYLYLSPSMCLLPLSLPPSLSLSLSPPPSLSLPFLSLLSLPLFRSVSLSLYLSLPPSLYIYISSLPLSSMSVSAPLPLPVCLSAVAGGILERTE